MIIFLKGDERLVGNLDGDLVVWFVWGKGRGGMRGWVGGYLDGDLVGCIRGRER